jgi:hypothetical protein
MEPAHETGGWSWTDPRRATPPAPISVSRSGAALPGHAIGMSQEPDLAVIQVDRPLAGHLGWAPTAWLQEGQPLRPALGARAPPRAG